MAAPSTASIKDLNGRWTMNKTLSGDFDSILSLQGVGWLMRKTIGVATITLHIKQYNDDKGITHIDIDQVASGGFKGTSESRALDSQSRSHTDYLFGTVDGYSKTLPVSSSSTEKASDADPEDDKWLKEGWEQGTTEVVWSYVKNKEKGWDAWQTWGFRMIKVGGKEERRYARQVVVRKGKEVRRITMVYDYVGALE